MRHRAPASVPGWTRLGLETSAALPAAPAPVERRDTILPGGRFSGLRRRVELVAQGARLASLRATGALARRHRRAGDLQLVEYANARGERIRTHDEIGQHTVHRLQIGNPQQAGGSRGNHNCGGFAS